MFPGITANVHYIMAIAYLTALLILTIYGVHRYWMVMLYYRHARKTPKSPERFTALPTITVQLPLFNERYVSQRVIEAACQLDYPADKLQIQVLDDSTDDSAAIAEAVCRQMRSAGHDVEYIHRTNRQGYKAGALENGLKTCKGEFIAIFDADFVPQRDMLKQAIDHFTDPEVGCVQTRWEHLNRRQSLLTLCQAIFLDGHFMIEHTARNRGGRFINFNGTGGIWRKAAIADAGGWQHDTLTEDMDLSYRAQLRQWKIVFLRDVVSPAELPPEIISFKQQQYRWTKGSAQTAIKILPGLMFSPLPLRVKIEAFFHLTSGVVYPSAVLLALLVFPTFCFGGPSLLSPSSPLLWALMMGLFTVMTFSAATFYIVAQKELGENWVQLLPLVPLLMAIGMGISLANATAVISGLLSRKSGEFFRTPKYGIAAGDHKHHWKGRARSFRCRGALGPYLEVIFGLYLVACMVLAVILDRAILCLPFLFIFTVGYFYVGFLSLYSQWLSTRGSSPPPPPTDSGKALRLPTDVMPAIP